MWIGVIGISCIGRQDAVAAERVVISEDPEMAICSAFFSQVSTLYSEEINLDVPVIAETATDGISNKSSGKAISPKVGGWTPSAPLNPTPIDIDMYRRCLKQEDITELDRANWWKEFCNDQPVRFYVQQVDLHMNENEAIFWARGDLGPQPKISPPVLFITSVRFAFTRDGDGAWNLAATNFDQRPVKKNGCHTVD